MIFPLILPLPSAGVDQVVTEMVNYIHRNTSSEEWKAINAGVQESK